MAVMNSLQILLVLVVAGAGEAARILSVVASGAPSHNNFIKPILRTLAEAGHEVVAYSIHPLKDPPPTYRDVLLATGTDEVAKKNARRFLKLLNGSPWNCLRDLLTFHDIFLNRIFEDENIKKLLTSDEHFDLVITEPFVAQEFTFIFGYKFNAPVIGLQSFQPSGLANLYTGNDMAIATTPDLCFQHSDKMSFSQRVVNAVVVIRNMYDFHYRYLPLVDGKLRAIFPDMPPLQEVINLSLMFVNDHWTGDYAKARPGTLVPVAGIAVPPERPLPQDFRDFMDGAANGVILFSLGSLIPDEKRPQEFFESISNTFQNLSQRVIWKTRKENLTGVTDNVKVVGWMPQRDILAHPNCVLFVTHGGQNSQYEAILSGVPVVGVPHFGDQHRNVEFYVAKEVGVKLLPDEISQETLTKAIRTVLDNRRYRDNMRRLSRVFQDTPMSPRESVVYWTEYVLRHRGAPHLTPSVLRLSWYQRYLLDVVALLLLLIFILCYIAYIFVNTILNCIRIRPNNFSLGKFKSQ